MNRRIFLTSSAYLGATYALSGCPPGRSEYDNAISKIWRHSEKEKNKISLMHELVRYATLAPSSHNTQCWKFKIQENSISIFPDLDRRCPAVDPDDHHVFVSIGCATENLVLAAKANGLQAEVFFETDKKQILIQFRSTNADESSLFRSIPDRQSTRGEFDGKPLSIEELKILEETGTANGVRVILLTERKAIENVLEFVVDGNTNQMNDPAFVNELKTWLRFSDAQAVRTGDGLFSRATGNPVVPEWIGPLVFDLFFKSKRENDKYARLVRSSAGIAIFVSKKDDQAHWLESGRAFERFALQATALGIRSSMLNQPVEVKSLRPRFLKFLGLTEGRPDLIVRFGRGTLLPRSLRRPVNSVII